MLSTVSFNATQYILYRQAKPRYGWHSQSRCHIPWSRHTGHPVICKAIGREFLKKWFWMSIDLSLSDPIVWGLYVLNKLSQLEFSSTTIPFYKKRSLKYIPLVSIKNSVIKIFGIKKKFTKKFKLVQLKQNKKQEKKRNSPEYTDLKLFRLHDFGFLNFLLCVHSRRHKGRRLKKITNYSISKERTNNSKII